MLRKPIIAISQINKSHEKKLDQENIRWSIWKALEVSTVDSVDSETYKHDGEKHARLPGVEALNMSANLAKGCLWNMRKEEAYRT